MIVIKKIIYYKKQTVLKFQKGRGSLITLLEVMRGEII